jgi:hypothetical protein
VVSVDRDVSSMSSHETVMEEKCQND